MRRGAWTLGLAALVCGACAHEQPPHSAASVGSATQDRLVVKGSSLYTEAKVSGPNIYGPAIDLTHDKGQLRGWAYNLPVSASIDEQKQQVRGIVGKRPLQLNVQPQSGGGVHAQGLIAGYLSDFTATPSRIQGRIGPCSYDLVYTGGAYEGSRGCRAGIEQLELRVPAVMNSWSPADAMASLGIFLLGRG